MKRLNVSFFALAVALYLCGMTAFAKQGHGGGRPGGGGPPGRPAPSERPAAPGGKGTESEPVKKTPSDLLQQNTKLASKVGKLTGMDPQKACAGFKNLGQCVAAAHVARNLGISFNTLKGKVTGPGAVSLGRAIHDLSPNVNAKAEAKKAKKEADEDMKGAGS